MVQLVRKQLATVVLNISALFTRMALTAKRRDDFAARLIVIPISASAIMDTERQVLHSFDDNACTKLEFNEAYSKSQLSIFSGLRSTTAAAESRQLKCHARLDTTLSQLRSR